MKPQDILNYVSRFLLTQNAACVDGSGACVCQVGNLRCALASLAIESDVTNFIIPHEIPSIKLLPKNENMLLLGNLMSIHDRKPISQWEYELAHVAAIFRLQPFGKRDLQSGRGKQNPLSIWYTDPFYRKELQKIHSRAGTGNLLEDYLKAWPVVTGGICQDILSA